MYISELQNGIIYIYILSNIFKGISNTLSQAIYEEKFWSNKMWFLNLIECVKCKDLDSHFVNIQNCLFYEIVDTFLSKG